IFVPASGNFARFLDVLSNPGSFPVTLQVGQETFLRGSSTRILVDPANTGNTYIALDESQSCCNRPNTAEVLAGADIAVPSNSVQLTDRGTTLRYRWNPITIQPGQTMNFLHYSVQHDPADNAGLQDEAQRLVNLTDPDALAGLTAQEQAAVV